MLYTLLLYHIPWLSDCGNKSKELNRDRQPFDDKVGANLSVYLFRRIYRMSRGSFDKLRDLLQPKLDKIFFPKGGGSQDVKKCRYLIDTKTRLSLALRFFAGADLLDIMKIHDEGLISVYYSVWGVNDAINQTEGLAYKFPDHDHQKEIARGFRRKSGAGCDNVIGAIDGLVICTISYLDGK